MKKILFLIISGLAYSQTTELVFVYFKDKPNASTFLSNPLTELSQQSINRRNYLRIPLTVQDAPIEPTYIQNIKNLGYIVTDYSKWLNGVALNATSTQISDLKALPYVDHVESFVKNPTGKISTLQKKFSESNTSKTGAILSSATQLKQINITPLHQQNLTGLASTIAVIDVGYPTVDTGSVFARLRTNNHIKGGYNFVTKNSDIYNITLNDHGTRVLSAMGGYVANQYTGGAPDADYYLYVSENNNVEIPEEELYWIEAAEEADRKGVDIITSSLGYSIFNDSRYNYSYSQMDGKTSFIARGAQIATEKGIIVLIAAGNEGINTWHNIITPADNASVFSVGAVTTTGASATFSSYGPNAAGVVKPDASALGQGVALGTGNSLITDNGTSFATPLAASGVACILQGTSRSMPRNTIKDELRKTASLYPNNTTQMGYGILNFYSAYNNILLGSLSVENNNKSNNNIDIFPNPAQKEIFIKTGSEVKKIYIYNYIGALVKTIDGSATTVNIESLNSGNYLLKVETKNGNFVKGFIKN